MSRERSALATLALASMLAVGCEDSNSSGNSTSRDRDGDGISDPYDRRPTEDNVPANGDVVGRRPDRTDSADAPSERRGLREIPREAVRVEEGVGDTLRYEADRDGRVYVYDEDDDKVVYSGNLYRGEDFVVDPESDVLSVGGKRLGDVNLRAAHRYRLYFMRD